MKIESRMGANRHDFGAKSGPSDQIGQPGHLASTCVHHNIGNELTVEVNCQGKMAIWAVLCTKC